MSKTALIIAAWAVFIGYLVWAEMESRKVPPPGTSYFEMSVDLVYRPTGDEVHIRFPFTCRNWRGGNLAGESFGRSELHPRFYGADLPGDNGDGVVIKTPNLCGTLSLPLERIVPENYLPVIYHVPDVENDVHFMVAHLSEASYDQEVSKFEFRKASVRTIEFEPGDEIPKTSTGTFPEDFFQSGKGNVRCNAVVPFPIPEEFRDEIREHWPSDQPDWWLLDNIKGQGITMPEINIKIREYWRKRPYELHGGDAFSYEGTSLRRPGGGGNLFVAFSGDRSRFGLAPRIPFKVTHSEPGNPDSLPVVNLVTEGGYNQGFGFCFPMYESLIRFGHPEPDTGKRRGGIFSVNGQEIYRGDIYGNWNWGMGMLVYKDELIFNQNRIIPGEGS